MNIRSMLWDNARSAKKKGMPILSFPAAQKMNVTVEELVKSSELQAQAMALIAKETDTLASVSLMDLSVEAEAFGAQVRFSTNEVPAIVGQLISDADEAEALAVPDMTCGRAGIFVEAVRQAKERIPNKPVIAGMIGPYSLAGRLMDVTEIMYACFDDPDCVHLVLKKAAEYLIRYGKAMKAAGADGMMMAEPLAGILSPDLAEEFSFPYVKEIISALQDEDFALIYHNCGGAVPSMLEGIFDQGAAAYHFGNAVDMAEILDSAPESCLCMGNIDPVSQFAGGTPASMRTAVQALMAACGDKPNFMPSSGCDIPYHAQWENIQAFFAALAE